MARRGSRQACRRKPTCGRVGPPLVMSVSVVWGDLSPHRVGFTNRQLAKARPSGRSLRGAMCCGRKEESERERERAREAPWGGSLLREGAMRAEREREHAVEKQDPVGAALEGNPVVGEWVPFPSPCPNPFFLDVHLKSQT